MARTPARRAQDGATFYARVGGSGRRWLAGLLPLLVLAAALTPTGRGVVARATGGFGAAAQDASPAALTASAADQLDAAVRQGGGGYTFTIVQRTALEPLPGGPLVDIPDPNDRHGSLGKTDHYELASYAERGAAAEAGFWSEIRDGPPAGEVPDFEKATYELGAIVRDGKTYRNDGLGWYPTSSPPGIGLDPVTAGLLPTMLRRTTDLKATTPVAEPVPGAVAAIEATTTVADLPGIIAVDGAAFTELSAPLDLSFDAQGRLVGLHSMARNLNADTYAMAVDTTITFDYPLFAPDIPKPDPLIDPDKLIKAEG